MANHISDFDPNAIWPVCPIAELVLVANDVGNLQCDGMRLHQLRAIALPRSSLLYCALVSAPPFCVLPCVVPSYGVFSYCAPLIEPLLFSQCVLLLCDAIA